MLERNIFYRPQERISSVAQNRETDTFIINTKWKEANFELVESIYGINEDADSFAVDINCILHKNLSSCLFIVIRPYNSVSLGGVGSIDYNEKTKVLKINGKERIYFESKPGYILAGNSIAGDIDFNRRSEKADNVKCAFGMAAMAFGYKLTRGGNDYNLRINLSDHVMLNTARMDYIKLRNKYIEYTNIKIKDGFKISFPEKTFQNWIYGAKISASNFPYEDSSKAVHLCNTDLKSIFYIISGYNRLGFFHETLKILELTTDRIKAKEKLMFQNVLDRCYFLNAVSDYFRLSRDIEYLKVKYKYLRNIILPLIQYSQAFKGDKRKYKKNSIENYYVLEYHIHDLLLISYTFNECSYMARCLGIFNDEKKFNKENFRLEELIADEIKNFKSAVPDGGASSENDGNENYESDADIKPARYKNEYSGYNIFAGYPFRVKALTDKDLKAIIGQISGIFTENPLYFKSIGCCDMFFSVIFAINLLIVKNARVHSIIEKLFEFGKEKYILPDYTNPKTGCGTRGEGDSLKVICLFITLLRSVIFIDSQDKLDIFPVPKAEWFIEGSEISVEDAPSLFGKINFKVISTKNEVQFYFTGLPKYLPPGIAINLPFPTKIKQEDDFLVKKEMGNSYLIHGWPSIIRFFKR
ncbi:MAG: hypothetical protein JXN64_00575 [Spirochaetes bacterium]|nr:hypothetical protein [Spirochaetota bacterium]